MTNTPVCPRDGTVLQPTAAAFGNETSALLCPKCGGVEAEWSVAQSLFTSLNLTLSDLQAAVKQAETRADAPPPMQCPACEPGQLKAFRVKGVELDVCTECGATWFDRSELSRITQGRLGKTLPTQEALTSNEKVIGVYEMWWDCPYCSTTGLLGASNRFCPQCGAAQDADRRYFPPPGKEVESNHAFDGADVSCPACNTPNGAKAVHCRQCGSPLDGSVQVAQVFDPSARQKTPAAAAAKKPRRKWPWVVAGLAALFMCTFCGVAVFWTKPAEAVVKAHTWSRSIEIEMMKATADSAWCDSLPGDAYSVSRHREQKSTNRIPDGQTCSTRNVDRGNGTFERREECHTKYREEPVYADKCSFTVNRWRNDRTLKATGEGLAIAPQWPAVSLGRTGLMLGAEREGARHEEYEVKLDGPQHQEWKCTVPAQKWESLKDGEKRSVKVSVILGTIACDSL